MIVKKLRREMLGFGALAVAVVVVGALLSMAESEAGRPVIVVGALLAVVVLATAAWDLLAGRD